MHIKPSDGMHRRKWRAVIRGNWSDRSSYERHSVTVSVIFVTKIKTRTRIIGRHFQRTRTRITV